MSYNHEIDYTLTRDEQQIVLLIQYDVAPFTPARIGGPPEDCCPAEGGEVLRMRAIAEDDSELQLTQVENEQLSSYIQEHHDYNASIEDDYDGEDMKDYPGY